VPNNNYAFIDAQNLHRSILSQGWKLDLNKFRWLLAKRMGVKRAFYCVGYMEQNEWLYAILRKCDYTLIFKQALTLPDGKIKGNVDAELVLQAMIEYPNYERAVIVSGDGDYACLVNYLQKTNKLERIVIPNRKHYSSLLRKLGNKRFFLSDLRKKLEYLPKKRGGSS